MPEGWRTRKLGEILCVQNGFAFDSRHFSKCEGVPLIRIRDLKDGHRTELRYVGQYDESYLVDAGDLLIGMDGEFRCYTWRGERALLNQRVCRLVNFADNVDPEFIALGINAHLKRIEDSTPYATVKHLSSKSITAIDFAFPGLAAQRRIVSRIKACMERVGEIEMLRERSRAQQQRLSASVIESELRPDHASGGWAILRIGELVASIRNGRSIRQATNGNADGAVLTLTAVRTLDLGVSYQKPVSLPEDVAEQFAIDEGDVFVSRANTIDLVGLSAIAMERPTTRLIYPDLLMKLKPDRSQVLPRFLAYALRSAGARAQIKERALGSSRTMVKISGERLREVSVPVPPLPTQEQIVARLDAAHDLIAGLSAEFASGEIPALRGAVIRRAFVGEP